MSAYLPQISADAPWPAISNLFRTIGSGSAEWSPRDDHVRPTNFEAFKVLSSPSLWHIHLCDEGNPHVISWKFSFFMEACSLPLNMALWATHSSLPDIWCGYPFPSCPPQNAVYDSQKSPSCSHISEASSGSHVRMLHLHMWHQPLAQRHEVMSSKVGSKDELYHTLIWKWMRS